MIIENLNLIILSICYLLGSVPFGIVFAKILKSPDLRKHGSGNIGATNAFRVGGKFLGSLTFLCDSLKSVLAIYIGNKFDINPVFSGSLAVIGHVFPIFLNFKGGKGVASFMSASFLINPQLGLFAAIIWLIIFAVSRISGLSSIIAVLFSVIYNIFLSQFNLASITWLALGFIILIKHKENINNLIKKYKDRKYEKRN